MTISEVRIRLINLLSPAVGSQEASAMANVIIEDTMGYKPIDVVLYCDRELTDDTVAHIDKIANRVVAGEPLQYVLGKAYFRGRYFKVNTSTLIPRPETAQLVDMVVDDMSNVKDAYILDIGTGSGCIAVSLALDLAFSHIDAVDISKGALSVASQNAKDLKASVNFIESDALHLFSSSIAHNTYDAIVSNPPYVLASERSAMDKRVVEQEPSLALFVPDNTPLIFYEAIADYGINALKPHGKLYFEINPLCAEDLRDMLSHKGYENVDVIRDYTGKYRFAVCQKH